MKAARTWFVSRSRNFRPLAALLCLGLFLLVEVFAASGSLHEKLHTDASAPGHHCVVTLLSQGQLDVSSGAIGCILVVLGFAFSLPWFYEAAVSSFDYQLAPSRGPPRF
jgi:hypothetical protein